MFVMKNKKAKQGLHPQHIYRQSTNTSQPYSLLTQILVVCTGCFERKKKLKLFPKIRKALFTPHWIRLALSINFFCRFQLIKECLKEKKDYRICALSVTGKILKDLVSIPLSFSLLSLTIRKLRPVFALRIFIIAQQLI